MIYTSNIDVAKQVAGGSQKDPTWMKPIETLGPVLAWGMNLFAAPGGELWRRHRRITGSAFNHELYNALWNDTTETYRQMVLAEGWEKIGTFETESVWHSFTLKFSTTMIAKTGFGLSFDWKTPIVSKEGTMTVEKAFQVFGNNLMLRMFVPASILKILPFERFKQVRAAETALANFARECINERGHEIKSGHANNDILTALVGSNTSGEEKLKLTDEELVGSIYTMLLGGHETTANILAGVLGLLAYHEDIQEEIYQHIIESVGHDQPGFEDMSKLGKVQAAFYEGIRMFPAAPMTIREPIEDTVLRVPRPRGTGDEGDDLMLPISRKTWVVVDLVGMNFNPRYFDDPYSFKPSRWYDMAKSEELLTGFGIGARECIGRKFTTTEVVCLLTNMIRDWRVEPILGQNESREMWRKSKLDGQINFSLRPNDIPLKFVRREV